MGVNYDTVTICINGNATGRSRVNVSVSECTLPVDISATPALQCYG